MSLCSITCCGLDPTWNVDQKCLFTDGGGRGILKTAHSDVPFSILRNAALDEESDESEIGHDCLSEGDIEEALSAIKRRETQFPCVQKWQKSKPKETKQLPSVTTRRTRH